MHLLLRACAQPGMQAWGTEQPAEIVGHQQCQVEFFPQHNLPAANVEATTGAQQG